MIYTKKLTGIVLVDGPSKKKNVKIIIEKNGNWILAQPEDERDLANSIHDKFPEIKNFNKNVGFFGF